MVKNKIFHLEDLSDFQIKRCGTSKGRLAVNNKAGIIYSKVKKKCFSFRGPKFFSSYNQRKSRKNSIYTLQKCVSQKTGYINIKKERPPINYA